MTDAENKQRCEKIANDLREIAQGLARVDGDGTVYFPGDDIPADEDPEDFEVASMYDYFNDVLDIEYRVGSDGEYRSVCLCVTTGGPGIYIDTASKKVELYWWGERADAYIDDDVCEQIDEMFDELWASR